MGSFFYTNRFHHHSSHFYFFPTAATIDDISVFVVPLGPYYRDTLMMSSSMSISSSPDTNANANDNLSCTLDNDGNPKNFPGSSDRNANNTLNNNVGVTSSFTESSSTSLNNQNSGSVDNSGSSLVVNGVVPDSNAELVVEAIDLEMDEPNH